MSDIYKGYELAEALDNGIFSKEQKVTGAGYFNCTIGFILKDVGNNFLFKDFEIIEEQEKIDIQEIKKFQEDIIEQATDDGNMKCLARKCNELVQAVKQLDKNIKEKQ